MIDPGYVRLMARYNAWQNAQLIQPVSKFSPDEAVRDRGSFFGSILGTLNHLLWGDTIWMSRFTDRVPKPPGGIPESVRLTANVPAWRAERERMDGQIQRWAQGLSPDELAGDLAWFSGAVRRDVVKPIALCITHFFNHQTHHRGQVHAMLTAAGHLAPASDLFLLPDEVHAWQ